MKRVFILGMAVFVALSLTPVTSQAASVIQSSAQKVSILEKASMKQKKLRVKSTSQGTIKLNNGIIFVGSNCSDLGKPDSEQPKPEQPKPEQPTPEKPEHSYAEQVLKLVNVERKKAGVSPLTMGENLQKAAIARMKEIQKSFSHTRPDGSNFATALKEYNVSYQGAGENIAWGQKTPEEVVNSWMNSPSHRANILNKNYKNIGIGHGRNTANADYWVQLFTY